MKKVLFYIDTLGKGGLDKVVLDVVNNMDFSKYDVTVMRRFPGGYYSQFLDERIHTKANVPFEETCSKTYDHLVRVICDRLPRKLIYRLFVHKKYDIEIACGDAFAATLIGGSTNPDSLKILWEHMDVTKDISTATYYNEEQVQKFFEPFDKIIGVSKDCRDKFIEKYGFKERVSYIYNPVDIKEIEAKSKEFTPKELGKEEFNILSIGRFMPQKAFVRLINVCAKLRKEGLKFKLNIIGEGPEEEIIKETIIRNNMEDYVNLLGFKENPYPYIKNSDLFVCASIHESYCLVVAESLVIGTPVLSTECTGPVELLENGRYGMLVENNEKGLIDGIRILITDNIRLKHYKEITEDRKEFFSVRECINQWETIFDEV